MLDEKFIRRREADLKKTKLRLETELGKMTKQKGKGRQAIFPDIGDKEDESAQEVEMYESSLTIERNLTEMLKETNIALDRIDKKTYGKCEKCGKDISEERLEAYPEAAACLKCLKK